MKKLMFLEIMKCIHKSANLQNAGVKDSSQLLASLFSLKLRFLKVKNSN